jgi:hypothetical protein
MLEMMSNSCLNWQVLLLVNCGRAYVLTEILNDDFRCLLQLPTLPKNLTVCEVIGIDDEYENDASALSIISKQ